MLKRQMVRHMLFCTCECVECVLLCDKSLSVVVLNKTNDVPMDQSHRVNKLNHNINETTLHTQDKQGCVPRRWYKIFKPLVGQLERSVMEPPLQYLVLCGIKYEQELLRTFRQWYSMANEMCEAHHSKT